MGFGFGLKLHIVGLGSNAGSGVGSGCAVFTAMGQVHFFLFFSKNEGSYNINTL